MPEDLETRAELLEAMEALHRAHAALIAGDAESARTQLDKAAVIIGEIRKKLFTP